MQKLSTVNKQIKMDAMPGFIVVYLIISKLARNDGCRCRLDSNFTQNPLRAEHAHLGHAYRLLGFPTDDIVTIHEPSQHCTVLSVPV